MIHSLRILACILVGVSASAVFQPEDSSQCLNKDLVSLVQGGVEIHRHDAQWPNIGSIIDKVETGIGKVTHVVQDATNTILTKPLVNVADEFDKALKNLDGTVQDLWSKANASMADLVNTIDQKINVSADGVTDSAAVNMALNQATLTIERVTSGWSDVSRAIDDVSKFLLNDLSTTGFKDLAKSWAGTLESVTKPIQQTVDKLKEVKADLQRGAQPWVSNADTDKPIQDALDDLSKATHDLASNANTLADWFQTIIDKINEVAKANLAGDQAAEIKTALAPIPKDVQTLLDDLTGGLFSFAAEFHKQLSKVKSVTAAAAQSAAVEPRSLSLTAGALALVALVRVVA